VHRQQFLDSLELEDYSFLDDCIDSISAVEFDSFVLLATNLTSYDQSRFNHFVASAFVIGTL